MISVDTKKKELIGNFANKGTCWRRERDEVNAHDFRRDASAKAVPYGIYDLQRNDGFIAVGTGCDTPRFSVESLHLWWQTVGRTEWPDATRLRIEADAGGSNAAASRVWKVRLQEFADASGLEIEVAHLPTGASKWNPVEHRLFGPISTNWSGQPLRSLDVMLACINGTTSETGLHVTGVLLPGEFPIGERVTDTELAAVDLTRAPTCPAWNYTIAPRQGRK